MRKGTVLVVMLILATAVMFVSTGLYAGTKAPDVIKMQNKAYAKHTKPIVTFEHKKHMEVYTKANPKLYPNGCGDCHHDQNGKPLKDLKAGNEVKSCIECHKEPGQKPAKEKLDKKEKIKKYQAEAIHENCGGCHSDFNKAKKLKSSDKGAAPTKSRCKDCHKK
jgi:hypothetical protein